MNKIKEFFVKIANFLSEGVSDDYIMFLGPHA